MSDIKRGMNAQPEPPSGGTAAPAGDSPFQWPEKRDLLGVGVTAVDYATIIALLFDAAHRQVPTIVEHLAVNNLIIGVRDPVFRDMLNRFDVVTMDGQGIRYALSLLHGVKTQDRVTARELMALICAQAAQEGDGIYLYGDEVDTVMRLEANLRARFPGIRIAGCEPSLFRPLTATEDAGLTARIKASGAAFVFVGLGCPLQEQFVYNHRYSIPAVQLCVGSAFKYLAGERAMAPRWMQRAGLEWTYRLTQDPGRLWKRYLYSNSVFLVLVLADLLRRLFRKAVAP